MRIVIPAVLLATLSPAAAANAQAFDTTLPQPLVRQSVARPLPSRIAAVRSFDDRMSTLRRDVAAQTAADGGTLTPEHNRLFVERYVRIRNRLAERYRRTNPLATNADGSSATVAVLAP